MNIKSLMSGLEKWPVHETQKPKYLLSLENYVKQKSTKINKFKDEQEKASLNLQIYREVFVSIIDAFKTYGPLMALIKEEYEKYIKFQARKIDELQPLHQALFSMANSFDDQIVNIQEGEQTELNHLKIENKALKHFLEKINGLNSEQANQIALLSKELQVAYSLYKDEKDGKDIVIKELCKLNLSRDISRLTNLSQSDSEVMQKISKSLFNEDYEALQKEYKLLLESYKEVLLERDELRDKITYSK